MDNLTNNLFRLSINENTNEEQMIIENNIDVDLINKLTDMSLHNYNNGMNVESNPTNFHLHNFNTQVEYITRFTSTGRYNKKY